MSRDEVVTASVHITESPCFKVLLLIYTAAPNMAILSLTPLLAPDAMAERTEAGIESSDL